MLAKQLLEDYKNAMKNKQEIKKSVLNFLLAQIKNKQIEVQRELDDDEIIALIKKEIKTINESITFLEKANKTAELEEENQKKTILQTYLPAMLTREQTKDLIETTIQNLAISDLKSQRGTLMKELMNHHRSELDGSLVNEIINEML